MVKTVVANTDYDRCDREIRSKAFVAEHLTEEEIMVDYALTKLVFWEMFGGFVGDSLDFTLDAIIDAFSLDK